MAAIVPRHVQDGSVKGDKHQSFTDSQAQQVSIRYLFVPKEPIEEWPAQLLPGNGNGLVMIADFLREPFQHECRFADADIAHHRSGQGPQKARFGEWAESPLDPWDVKPLARAPMMQVVFVEKGY
jgi:hypothetical protein